MSRTDPCDRGNRHRMSLRRKSRRKSRLERLLSFNQHRRRWGAAKYTAADADLAAMKARLLGEGLALRTRGSQKSLDRHIENLRCEFSGQSELLWHHARLIVLTRVLSFANIREGFSGLFPIERGSICHITPTLSESKGSADVPTSRAGQYPHRSGVSRQSGDRRVAIRSVWNPSGSGRSRVGCRGQILHRRPREVRRQDYADH